MRSFAWLVAITGDDLTGTTAVQLGTVNAPGFTVNPAGTTITVTVPAGAPTAEWSVATPTGTATSVASFTVLPAPAITAYLPGFGGAVGSTVTLNGTGFSGTSSVRFGTLVAEFTVVDDTHVTAKVPPGAVTAPISLTAPGGTATSPTSFPVSATVTIRR